MFKDLLNDQSLRELFKNISMVEGTLKRSTKELKTTIYEGLMRTWKATSTIIKEADKAEDLEKRLKAEKILKRYKLIP